MDVSVVVDWWKEAFKPEPLLTVSEWADGNRILSRKSSSEPGRWRTERTPYLREIMDCLSVFHPCKKVVFKKASQIGGALALDTPIPTPNGWSTMGDLRQGDFVFDENGTPCRVVFKSEVFHDHECFEIEFSDGEKIICDHVHKWRVHTNHWKKPKDFFTPKIFETFKEKKGKGNRYFIPIAGPLKCENKRLPIDPYQFGVWLGDGNRHTGQLYLNLQDAPEILQHFSQEHLMRPDSENCVNVLVSGFCSALNQAGLLRQKRIPSEYLRADYSQRLSLLQGLMDTDGSVSASSGRCEFSTRDESLKDGFCELLSSMGIKFSLYSKRTTRGFRGQELASSRMQWRISFLVLNQKIFRLERKQNLVRFESSRATEMQRRRIVSVRRVPTVQTACIEVDSASHLYLCGQRMVPTHNTECGNNWLGYVIDHAPGPMLLVQPTVDLSKRNSRLRVEPLIEESPTLKQKTKPLKSRDSSNTVLQKDFEGGTLVMTGANSAAGLRSMPARYIMFDEIDAYPRDVEGEGSPISLALARSRTFSRRKAFFCSTPTFEGDSIIDDEFELSDKRFFEVPCPDCGKFQVLKFENLEWPESHPEQAQYACEHCGVLIDEKFKTKMLQGGKWVATNPESRTPGFHINSLYSPVGWYSWGEIATDYVEAKRQYEQEKKTEKMKTFTNTVKGLSYKEPGEAPEWKRLYLRREKYPMKVVPEGGKFLTCGVDVQKDRLEAEVIAWAPGFENWSVDYQVFNGETSDEKVWNDLASYIEKSFPVEGGGEMPIQLCAIDSGYNTQHVYNFCRKYSPTRVVPVKGVDDQHVLVAQPRQTDVKVKGKPRVRRGVVFWNVGVNLIKSELYGWLKSDPPIDGEPTPSGFCHFPEYGDEYFKQLCSERIVIRRDKKNRNIIEWVKSRERNEALDVRIYNRAAASLVGIDRFKPNDWERFRVQVLAKTIEPAQNRTATPKKKTSKRTNRRESFW